MIQGQWVRDKMDQVLLMAVPCSENYLCVCVCVFQQIQLGLQTLTLITHMAILINTLGRYFQMNEKKAFQGKKESNKGSFTFSQSTCFLYAL